MTHAVTLQIVLALALLTLLVAACGGEPPATLYQYSGYLAEEIPPCTPVEGYLSDPCRPDDDTTDMEGITYSLDDEPPGMGNWLNVTDLHVAHLVVRANYLPDTVRCAFDKDHFRLPSYIDDEWVGRRIKCFVDLRVNAYVLGSGPSTLTVSVGGYGYSSPSDVETSRVKHEQRLTNGGISTRERMFFIGPSPDVQTESWEVMTWWDLERKDGKVIALHPERDIRLSEDPRDYEKFRSVLELELPAFTQTVTTAHSARMTANGGRIGADAGYPLLRTDANNLSLYFTEIDAYDHPNGPPAAPPPACGLAVPGDYNSGLMQDCTALLAVKDILRGTAQLNWDTGTAITEWDGVTTAGTPARVTKLLLSDKSMDGSIPEGLGGLYELTTLTSVTTPLPVRFPATSAFWTISLRYAYRGTPLPAVYPTA